MDGPSNQRASTPDRHLFLNTGLNETVRRRHLEHYLGNHSYGKHKNLKSQREMVREKQNHANIIVIQLFAKI